MMKRILYIMCFLFVSIIAAGETVTTTERVTFGNVELQPGGDMVKIPVHLETAYKYTAVTMDIVLPEGLEFAFIVDRREEIYAEEGWACSRSHSLGISFPEDNTLRVVLSSNENTPFYDDSPELFLFYVKANTLARPGSTSVIIKECFYNDPEGNEYDVDDLHEYSINDKVSVSTSAKASFNISAENKWSTLVLPFDVPSLPSEVMAFTCNESDDNASVLILNRVSSLSAYKPYILRSENGCTVNLSGTVDANNYPATGVVAEGYLKGAVTQQVATSGEYVLANKDGKTQFYKVANSKTIPAGKCWMALPSGMSAKENFGFQISTGIKNVVSGKGVGTKYSLDGRKINVVHPQQLYIEGGKKKIGR